MSGFVYFIESEQGHLKVGFSRSPQSRFNTIRSHSPLRCRLIALVPGDRAFERAMHEFLSECRSHAEWFEPSIYTSELIRRYHGKGLSRVEDWHETGIEARNQRYDAFRARLSAAAKARWADPAFRARVAARNVARKSRPTSQEAA